MRSPATPQQLGERTTSPWQAKPAQIRWRQGPVRNSSMGNACCAEPSCRPRRAHTMPKPMLDPEPAWHKHRHEAQAAAARSRRRRCKQKSRARLEQAPAPSARPTDKPKARPRIGAQREAASHVTYNGPEHRGLPPQYDEARASRRNVHMGDAHRPKTNCRNDVWRKATAHQQSNANKPIARASAPKHPSPPPWQK